MGNIMPKFRLIRYSDLTGTIKYATTMCRRKGCSIEQIIEWGHDSVLEHGSITVEIVCSRGCSHELVRHRLASFTQESTRYIDWRDIDYIGEYDLFVEAIIQEYLRRIDLGVPRDEARKILPICTATRILVTANPREWRHIFKLRTANAAHPEIRGIMRDVLRLFAARWPEVFSDLPHAT